MASGPLDIYRSINHDRAIAAQVLCNLAKSDPHGRLNDDFAVLFAITGDARFVTARHCMQALWKVGAAGARQRSLLLDAYDRRYRECITEKNGTLVRSDIIESLARVHAATGEADAKAKVMALLAVEADPTNRAKYASVWRAAARPG